MDDIIWRERKTKTHIYIYIRGVATCIEFEMLHKGDVRQHKWRDNEGRGGRVANAFSFARPRLCY